MLQTYNQRCYVMTFTGIAPTDDSNDTLIDQADIVRQLKVADRADTRAALYLAYIAHCHTWQSKHPPGWCQYTPHLRYPICSCCCVDSIRGASGTTWHYAAKAQFLWGKCRKTEWTGNLLVE